MPPMKLYKFLRLFWVPKCKHRWEFKYTQKVTDTLSDYWNEKVCQCSKCGAWKSFKV